MTSQSEAATPAYTDPHSRAHAVVYRRYFRTRVMRTTIVSICAFAVFLLLMELLFRAVVFVGKGSKADRYLVLPERKLGWVLNTNMIAKHLKNRCGEQVDLSPPPHRLIIKYPQAPGERKILFLGDSFTHAHEVSTGKAYYDVFEALEQGTFEVYAAAVGGYSNLQEFLMLEEVYPQIEPDIVAWQLTGNDVSNNVFELDDDSILNNQRPRPFLDPGDGGARLRNPGFWIFDWSEGFTYLFQRVLALDAKYGLGIEYWLKAGGMDRETARKHQEVGLSVLDFLVERAVETWPDTVFVGFSVDSDFDQRFERIFNRNDALYIPGFFRAMGQVDGINCQPLDSHWNHLGNEVAARVLSERLGELLDPLQSAQ